MKLPLPVNHFSYFLVLLGLFVACSTESNKSPKWDLEIRDRGLSFISIGDKYALLDSLELPFELSEPVFNQEQGYVWLIREMALDSGKVTFEGNYFKEQDISETDLRNSYVNRIRIESPMLTLANGVKTGITYGELKGRLNYAELELILLTDYRMIDISAPDMPTAHFLFPCPDTLMVDSTALAIQIPPGSLPENSPMEAIVIL